MTKRRSPWAGTGAAECLVDTYACALSPTMASTHARLVFTRHIAILSEEARGALVALVALEPGLALAAPILQAKPMCRAFRSPVALNLAILPVAPWPTMLAGFARKARIAYTFPAARALSMAAARTRPEALDLAVTPVPAFPASTAIGPNVSVFTSTRLPITHASTVR